MSLDLNQTIPQIESLAVRLRDNQESRATRLSVAVSSIREANAEAINQAASAAEGRLSFLPAGCAEEPWERHPPNPLPSDFSVLSVDGSHIDVDRHLPTRCYLINLGGCLLTYGSQPNAHLFSRPRLYFSDEELSLKDTGSKEGAQLIHGALLGLKRTVEEAMALTDLARLASSELPALALLDGSLILWELGGQSPPRGLYPEFVRRQLLDQGFLAALDALRELGGNRAIAGYISMPNSTEVINALHLVFCPASEEERFRHRPCDILQGLVDRDLFGSLLSFGERSGVFFTRSPVVMDSYGDHRVHFFYLNVGPEIARVEIPAWVAEEKALLELVHIMALDQCRRGDGYPTAIQEAHEQAVVTTGDRQQFRQLIESALESHRLPVYTSEKQRSKRGRWI